MNNQLEARKKTYAKIHLEWDKFAQKEIEKRKWSKEKIAVYYGLDSSKGFRQKKEYELIRLDRNSDIRKRFSKGWNKTRLALHYGLKRNQIHIIIKSFYK